MYKFRNVSRDFPTNGSSMDGDVLTPLQVSFNAYLTIASSLPLTVLLMLNTALSEKVPVHPRVEWSTFVNIVVFGIFSTTTFVNTDNSEWTELYLLDSLLIASGRYPGDRQQFPLTTRKFIHRSGRLLRRHHGRSRRRQL